MLRSCLSLVLLVVSGCATAPGQRPDERVEHGPPREPAWAPAAPAPDAHVRTDVQRAATPLADVTPGQLLRVQLHDGSTVVAPFQASREDRLFLQGVPGTGYPLEEVHQVAVQERLTGRGATIGAIVLGLVGTGLGAVYYSFVDGMCGDEGGRGCPPSGLGVPLGTLGGAAVGGLFGAFIGTAVTDWRQVHLRPAAAR